jgi:FtsH-binding integral membrane protein
MEDTTRPVPDHVPDEWTARYADPRPEDLWARRLAEVERSARSDTRWLTLAGVMCVLVLLLALGWAGLLLRAALAQRAVIIVVIAAAFAVCLWLVRRTRHARRP